MKANRTRRSAAQWQELIRRWSVSKLSVTEFCDDQDISVSSLYYWRKQLEAEPDPVEAADTGSFIKLSDSGQSSRFDCWDIELELGGMILRLRST